jgi:hypothetical protein
MDGGHSEAAAIGVVAAADRPAEKAAGKGVRMQNDSRPPFFSAIRDPAAADGYERRDFRAPKQRPALCFPPAKSTRRHRWRNEQVRPRIHGPIGSAS